MHNDDSSVKADIAGLETELQAALKQLEQLREAPRVLRTAAELEAFEREVAEATDRVAALTVALKLQASLDSPELQAESAELAKASGRKMRHQGRREVEIRFARGGVVRLKVSYWSGKRGGRKRGSGFYPGLVLLGIYEHCTPLLASDLAQLAAAAGSLAEAVAWLADHGVKIDIKTLRAVVYALAERARLQQQAQRMSFPEKVAGRRVAVSTDGGRIRIRRRKKGPKTKKGRSRYSTHWREPKLLIIYLVNEQGEIDRSFPVYLDGTLKGPDAIFGLLHYYLSQLQITQADQVVFVADGAAWIWERVGKLVAALGLRAEQVVEVIDFYHAVEHLGKVAALQPKWSAKQRKSWVRTQRKKLLAGQVDQVIEAIARLSAGRKSKLLDRELEYFRKHRQRMAYARVKELGLPIGSGAIESAVRRVVNLRLKGPGIFWERESAEAMLMLRAYHKAGRWKQLKEMAFMLPETLAA